MSFSIVPFDCTAHQRTIVRYAGVVIVHSTHFVHFGAGTARGFSGFPLIRALLITAACALRPASAGAETVNLSRDQVVEFLVALKQYELARRILTSELSEDPGSVEANFLMGEIDTRQHKYSEAIPYYRKILVNHPGVVRVRLDLARALFETADDEAAEYNFRLALAQGDLPRTVIDNIERYLAIIRSRRHLVFDLNFGVVPSTNINQANTSSQVVILGLPATLSPSATKKSGVGVTGTVSGEYRADLSPGVRLRTGASVYTLKYPDDSQFDDTQARGYVGPQWLFGRGDISVLGVVARRWYGDKAYSTGVGGRLEGQVWVTPRILYTGAVEGLSMDYDSQKLLEGYYLDQTNFLDYYTTPTSFIRATLGYGYQKAASTIFSNVYYRVGVAYQREFEYGITANLAPQAVWWNYQETNPLFGNRRVDRQYGVIVSAYKRDFTVFGFAPVVSYAYTTNQSTQSVFKYDDSQFKLGLTKQF